MMIYPFVMDEENYEETMQLLHDLPPFEELQARTYVGSGEDFDVNMTHGSPNHLRSHGFDYEAMIKRSIKGDNVPT